MASEAGHVQGEGLLRGYDFETFLDGTIELPFFLATSKLLNSMASEVIRGHLRPLNHKLLFVILLRSRLLFACFYGSLGNDYFMASEASH